MKRQLIILICAAAVFSFAGCGNQNVKQSAREWDPNLLWDGKVPEGGAIPDFFEGMPPHGGEFPKLMAGIWEGEIPDVKWDIKLEPSGSILRIVHPVAGKVDMSQGAVQETDSNTGSYYIFHMGPCESRYDSNTGMVRIKIVVDYFIMKMPAGEIEGRMEDYFDGLCLGRRYQMGYPVVQFQMD
jgi:hypothetical protein